MFEFFSIDSPFGRFMNVVYYILLTNLLWIIFSLPIFTIGASTTAMYYVMGKVVNDEGVHVIRDFWKSFKMNFKQTTVIWIALLAVGLVILADIENVHVIGKVSVIFLPLLVVLLIELLAVTVYIFPLVSRYYLSVKTAFKQAFLIGNKHLVRTIACIVILGVLYSAIYIMPILMFIFFGLYVYLSYRIIRPIFKRYEPEEERKDGNNDDSEEFAENQ